MKYEAPDSERLEELFHALSELDASGRKEFLDANCADDPALRDALEKLLHADEEAAETALLSTSALHLEARELAGGDLPLDRVGPYRILSRLGSGGMGIVYLADRDDGQFRMKVAVKVIACALQDESLAAQFRHERQILANLDHPNITRLLDGGVTASGSPYLVMEYVDGVPIHEYASAHRLPVRERIALFLQVSAAVAYAHRNLVVHRDLKPGNILVTSTGIPKLLDFGIAKLLGDAAPAQATGALMMTPGYASPEQLRGESVTTATDIYSLGMVLYEVLIGARPFRESDSVRAGREIIPIRPASLVTPAAAAQRSTTPEALRRALEGDLTTVLAKALAYNPVNRYSSVDRFAEDLERHLAGRPILARPQTLLYRAGKFIARNRFSVAIALLALVSIVGGAAAAIVQERVAERRFAEVRQLAHYVLFDLYEGVGELGGSTRVRAQMAQRATGYLNALAGEAQKDAGLRMELADGYRRLGDIQGNVFGNSLGDTRSALDSYARGLTLLGRDPHNPREERLRALFEMNSAEIASMTTVGDDGVARMRTSLAHFERSVNHPPSPEDDFQLGRAYLVLAMLEQQRGGWVAFSNASGGDLDRAEPLLRRAIASAPDIPAYRYTLAQLLDRRAQMFAVLDPKQTIAFDMAAMDVLSRAPEAQRGYLTLLVLTAQIHGNMGWGYGQINQFDAALDHCRQAEQIYLPLVAADPADNGLRYKLAVIRRNAGIINGYAKRWSDGAAEFAKGIADYDVLLKAGPNKRYRIYQADLTMRMANALLAAGRPAEAETTAAAGISTFREIAHSQDVAFPDIRVLVTYLLESPLPAVRDPKEALALLDQPRWRGQADTFEFNEVLAMAYRENHRYREAADTMRKALSLMPPTKPGDPPNRARQEIEESLARFERDAK
jgi:eukaryotic-like serine/threonine-protein kinase